MFRSRGALPFLALTFALSWSSWAVVIVRGRDYLTPSVLPFFLFGSFGPSVAAAILRWADRGGVQPVLAGSARVGVARWLPIAIGLGAAGGVAAAGATAALGLPGVDLAAGRQALTAYGNPVVFLAVFLLIGPVSEEPGWRGYLYPRLRERAEPGRIALVLGPIWALWHLPLFLIPGTYQNSLGVFSWGGLLFVVSTVGLIVALCYAYERLRGVAASITAHFASNVTPAVLGLTSIWSAAGDAVAKLVLAAVLLLIWPTGRLRRRC